MRGVRFALVVVNYGSHALVAANLPRRAADEAGAKVFLVDNLSTEGERRAVAELCAQRGWVMLPQEGNPGFAAGVNRGVGAAIAEGFEVFVTLNPDATADALTLAALARGVREDPLTVASPLVVRSSGGYDFRGSTVSLRSGRIRTGWVPGDDDEEWKNWLTGACLAFSRDTFEVLGGLDPRYFLYWEDVDFSRRAVEAGRRLVLREDLCVLHDEGGTHTAAGSRAKSSTYYYHNCRNRLLFGSRFHRGTWGGWLMSTPEQTWRIWTRGGRRQLLTSPGGAVAAVRGSIDGMRAARRHGGRVRPGAGPRPAVVAATATDTAAPVARGGTRPAGAAPTGVGTRTARRAGVAHGRGRTQAVGAPGAGTRPAAPRPDPHDGPRQPPVPEGKLGGRTILVAHPSADLYGSDRVLLESVSALCGAGARVVVVLPGDGPLCEELRLRGARVEHCPTPVLRKSHLSPRGLVSLGAEGARGAATAGRLLRALHPDLVIVNTITIPLWLVLARARGIPTLCHVHEAERSISPAVRRGLYAPLLLATRLVTNSRFSLGVLTDTWERLAERTSVLHNGVPGPLRAPEPRASLGEGPVNILYIGRLSPRKGPQVALAAHAHLRDMGHPAHLRLLGSVFPGYEWFEEELHSQVRSLGIADEVEFLGFDTDIWRHFAAADVILVPSTVDEPFGNTAVEAMLARRPLVVSATSGLKEAASGYAAVRRVPPGDVPALARAVVDLVQDWTNVITEVDDDRDLALVRHAPALYRRRFVEEVLEIVPVVREPVGASQS